MRALPLDIGTIHFVGIGGIGMSGIAEILHNLGYKVQGTDLADSANVKRLREHRHHGRRSAIAPRISATPQVVVVSSAVKPDNPEVVAARARLLPVVRRAEMLAELMRLKWSIAVGGTHGKTTTTSMVAALLDAGGLDPTVDQRRHHQRLRHQRAARRAATGWWSRPTKATAPSCKLPATIAVVTNIDPEHLDHYGTFDALNATPSSSFVENIPFYGFAVLCIDHPEVQALIPRVADRRIITYGFSPQADVRAVNLEHRPGGADFDVVDRRPRHATSRAPSRGLRLPMLGAAQRAERAGRHRRRPRAGPARRRRSAAALAGFAGVKRRFTKTGEVERRHRDRRLRPPSGRDRRRAARRPRRPPAGTVIAVVQPHRYTRLANLFEEFCTCFNDADTVLVADVYAAGEAPIEGVNRDALVEGLRAHGHRDVVALAGPGDLAGMVAELAAPGDLVVCLGAGSITNWAHALPDELPKLCGHRPPRGRAR